MKRIVMNQKRRDAIIDALDLIWNAINGANEDFAQRYKETTDTLEDMIK